MKKISATQDRDQRGGDGRPAVREVLALDAAPHLLEPMSRDRRAFFEAIGGADESFVRYGGEDTECGGRAQVRGGLHVPVQLADADPALEGLLGRAGGPPCGNCPVPPLQTS